MSRTWQYSNVHVNSKMVHYVKLDMMQNTTTQYTDHIIGIHQRKSEMQLLFSIFCCCPALNCFTLNWYSNFSMLCSDNYNKQKDFPSRTVTPNRGCGRQAPIVLGLLSLCPVGTLCSNPSLFGCQKRGCASLGLPNTHVSVNYILQHL